MGLKERIEICKKIESHRNRPLLVYVTSKREGAAGAMATDALPYLIEQLDSLPAGTVEIDFLLVSFGGDPMVAWRIMSLIRQRVDKVFVLIPQTAFSAATLLALGADEIVMHPNGHLGPVDMQITTFSEGVPRQFSTEDISAFLDFVRDELSITDQEHIRILFELTCKEVGSLGVGFTARSSRLAVALGEKLLAMHDHGGEHGVAARRAVIERLSRQFHSHAYPVNRSEAKEIGLSVNENQDGVLESLMWQLWIDIEQELKERTPFHPITELLNSAEAPQLLAPVPQLNLPMNAPGPTWFQTTLPEMQAAAFTQVNPIDFQTVQALMESARVGFHGITTGKILSCRQPDLKIHYNVALSFRGWAKTYS